MATQDNQGKLISSMRSVSWIRTFVDIKLLFDLFDVDNSGTLTKEELRQLLQSSDPTGPPVSEQQVAEYLKLADVDSNE